MNDNIQIEYVIVQLDIHNIKVEGSEMVVIIRSALIRASQIGNTDVIQLCR